MRRPSALPPTLTEDDIPPLNLAISLANQKLITDCTRERERGTEKRREKEAWAKGGE